jgi:hypothetical protein
LTDIDRSGAQPSATPKRRGRYRKKHAGKPIQITSNKPRIRFRGTPPPLAFDIAKLPASTLLTEREAAAVMRRPMATLEYWRQIPDHPLRWRRANGRLLYELGTVLEFLKDDEN